MIFFDNLQFITRVRIETTVGCKSHVAIGPGLGVDNRNLGICIGTKNIYTPSRFRNKDKIVVTILSACRLVACLWRPERLNRSEALYRPQRKEVSSPKRMAEAIM